MVERPGETRSARVSALATDLRVVFGQMKRRFRAEADPGDFTPSQTTVLSRLDRQGPATVTTLARGEGVRPQSMGATVAALEAAGAVAGTPDPNDGRQTLWSLTKAFQQTVRANRAAREDWLVRSINAKLTAAEQAELAAAVALLKRLVDE